MTLKDAGLLILAGGKSERMGTPKGLLEAKGKLWLERLVGDFLAAGGGGVCVVLGFDAASYQKALPRFDYVVNANPERGQLSSAVTGVGALIGKPVFLQPVDVPLPGKKALETILQALRPNAVVIPEREGKGGHPLLLSQEAGADLRRLKISPGDRLDVWVHSRPNESVVRAPLEDPRIGMNLNTPEVFKAYIESRY